MIKKFTIILILFLSITRITYADDCSSSCAIESGPASVLQDYIKNERTIITRITNLTAWKTSSTSTTSSSSYNSIVNNSTTLSRLNSRLIKWLNTITNYDDFYTSFYFFRDELFWSTPSQIKRDRNLIKNESDNLWNYMYTSIKKWTAQIEIASKDICDWIDNCNLSWTVLDILNELLDNNNKILSLFENSIMWRNTTTDTFIIVSDDFYKSMVSSYNKTTSEWCSKCEWWFFDKIKKGFSEISSNMENTWKATKYWVEAWNLLTWNMSTQEYQNVEKTLLAKELSRQWLSSSQSQIILNNLDKFNNNWWFSLENNFLVNSVNSWIQFIWKFLSPFNELIKSLSWSKNQETSIANINVNDSSENNTQNEYKNMQEVYITLNKQIWDQTNVDEATLNKLIQMHITLAKIIQNLKNTVEKSEAVCERQCSWVWNCTNY